MREKRKKPGLTEKTFIERVIGTVARGEPETPESILSRSGENRPEQRLPLLKTYDCS